jgi:hypothetical protein
MLLSGYAERTNSFSKAAIETAKTIGDRANPPLRFLFTGSITALYDVVWRLNQRQYALGLGIIN